jgi:putative transposase
MPNDLDEQGFCVAASMSPRRLFVPGLSHHVRHRGNNRSQVFLDDGDRKVFLQMVGRACGRYGLELHGYVLMGNHYHLQVTAAADRALPGAMQSLGRGYVKYFNDRYERSGTLWEGRYRASLILDERYWLTCLRYIERNPVAAGLVPTPDSYAWSSYAHHGLGRPDQLITTHHLYHAIGPCPSARCAAWRALCGAAVDDTYRALIRAALRSNAALYEPGFDESATPSSDAPSVGEA